MRFTVEYPVSDAAYDPALVTRDGMRVVAAAVEDAGFAALAFTEHPAPSAKWMNAGGHESLDVGTALAFCAAVTSRVSLMPYAIVLPYYNPFFAAKMLTTLALLSDDRLILVAGTGYLRSEFRALSVDMGRRNERFDESVGIMQALWTEDVVSHSGVHFEAAGVVQRPRPPRVPPILIGGNGRLARQRAAAYDGWSPLLISGAVTATVRTPAIASIEQLAAGIAEVRATAAEAGRDPASLEFQIQTSQARFPAGGLSVEQHRDHLGRLAEAGVTRFVVQPPGVGPDALADRLREYGDAFAVGART